jgi:hypothetical protein
MRYVSVNELSHFQFHDSGISTIDFDKQRMVWEVEAVNATTSNSQNDFSEDMCIKNAIITFENPCIESIVFGAYQVFDSNRNLIESHEDVTAPPTEYADILKNTPQSYCYILSMDELPSDDADGYRACFNIDGGAGNYYLTMKFSKSIIKWEEYSGKAWYESEPFKK